MADEREELEADIEKLHHTLEEDRNQWQYDDIVDSDDDSDDEDDALYIDLEKQGSATASVASASARSAGGRTTPSLHSVVSQQTLETQSLLTEQDDDAELFREVGVMQETLNTTPSSSLPATLESCLSVNRTYQEIIKEHIERIELELAENREAQRRTEEEAKESTAVLWQKKSPFTATTPYFKMKYGSTPAANEDSKMKQLTEEPDLDLRPEPPWYQRHKRALTQAVTEDALEKLLQPLLSRRELEEEKLQDVPEKSQAYQDISARIASLDKDMEEKRLTPADVLLQSVDPERVDWMKIANMNFQGRRSWTSCRRAWQHSMDPKLNQTAMDDEEERRLVQLIQETDGRNWVYIAQQLGTGRTAFQCLQYYQQNLNKEMLARPWTKEEDKQLVQVVDKCQQYHFNWTKVSHYMEGRSSMQCCKRFAKLDPSINKGHWTEEEDAELIAAVQLLGTHNWGRIHELVPGRTREQCRERYFNCLDPNISGLRWTYEEDRRLLQLVQQHGIGSWAKMCKDLPGRTDNQILQRHRRLEDWRKKTNWFQKQTAQNQALIQGNNLPLEERKRTQDRNWQQFREKFGVYPDDYRKQQVDRDNGKEPVPRPPLMIGLASRGGSKVWERRMKLHKLIEDHIEQLKDRYNFINPSVAGVFELRDAISQLSRDCISQRDQLMNMRKDQLGQMIHGLPSAINVKDLLAVSRGGKVHERKIRGPMPHRKRTVKQSMTPRLQTSMKLDAELRKAARSNLKERMQKKGRPRRFFWDVNGDQKMSDEDMAELKSQTLSLYLKSLGTDLRQLLTAGRRTYPELFHKLQQQQLQSMQDQEVTEPHTSDGTMLRRSRRARKPKAGTAQEEGETITDPFSVSKKSDQSLSTTGFGDWQKQRDYELLEWLARMEGVSLDLQHTGHLAMEEDIPAAGSMDITTTTSSTSAESGPMATGHAHCEGGGDQVIGEGMKLVQASIQQALEESQGWQSGPMATGHAHCEGGGDRVIGEGMKLVQASIQQALEESQGQQEREAASGDPLGTVSRNPDNSGGVDEADDSASHPLPRHESGGAPVAVNSPLTPQPNHSHSINDLSAPVALTSQSSSQPGTSRGTGGGTGGGTPGTVRGEHPPRPSVQRQLPNLPPTFTSLQAFRNLLLKRLGLITRAGQYYNVRHYQARKDSQLASLIRSGYQVRNLNRGTIDLSRMMNRVSQETNFTTRKKRSKDGQPDPSNAPSIGANDCKGLDFRVLEQVRKTREYQQLQSRFQALFTWPALLSAVCPPFQRRERAPGNEPASSNSDHHVKKPKTRTALLKGKRFYKFANKSKEEKQAILQKKKEQQILKQVQELLADEDDPNPEVVYEPEPKEEADEEEGSAMTAATEFSDDQSSDTGDIVLTSPANTEDGEAEGPPRKKRKKYEKRFQDIPQRQSSRTTERKRYTDRINRKLKQGPRKPRQPRSQQLPPPPPSVARAARLPRSVRAAMINAMVKMKDDATDGHGAALGKWEPGSYVSDDEDEEGDNMEEAMRERGHWLGELSREQRESLAVLERDSIVEPLAAGGSSSTPSTATVTPPPGVFHPQTIASPSLAVLEHSSIVEPLAAGGSSSTPSSSTLTPPLRVFHPPTTASDPIMISPDMPDLSPERGQGQVVLLDTEDDPKPLQGYQVI